MLEEIIDDSLKEKAEAVSKDRDQLVLKHILESDEMMIPMNHASAHLNENGIVKYHTFDEPISLKDFNGKHFSKCSASPSFTVSVIL